ncbi:hypothetical protein LWI29_037317 [Acer saccharum]|uniref:Uncharacterized protein n=1 Tax=Acer saccharum TaxID=4024 RepID=A0AA39VAC4_ACESA|nr:hypothetical protein LWI29_037317 [Acer saccharum]
MTTTRREAVLEQHDDEALELEPKGWCDDSDATGGFCLLYLSHPKYLFMCLLPEKAMKNQISLSSTESSYSFSTKQQDLPLLDLRTIASATNNFSSENKLGEGGFGPVYKGQLPDGLEIAVKRLSKTSGQGISEFKNEDLLIAKLQHRNLEEEYYKSRAEKLKEDVKQLFVEAFEVLSKLELIDSLMKLGLSNLFEEEIREALDTIASMKNIENLCGVEEDLLYATALYFRLLRQHGYEISPDIFSGFMDEKGRFSTSKYTKIKGVIELYEASHLGLEGENILVKAKALTTKTLKCSVPSSALDSNLITKTVSHALELSAHWRVYWFDVKWHINMYENDRDMNQILFELAKLNFNMVQATLQNDLRGISRWWRNLGLIENLNFTRDRLVESFMCVVGLAFQPKLSNFRKWLTKVIVFILVIDDIYDNYGSLEELQDFTNAVDRWDSKEIHEHSRNCIKLCFQALYDTTNQIAYEIQKEKDWKQWAEFCKALFVETKWYNEGYTPTLQEYLSNAWISSSGTVLAVHSIFSIMNEPTEEMAHFLDKNQDLVYNSSLIIRLCNDLATSAAELERGDVASSILCYMREANVSEEVARNHIKAMISETWTKNNGQCFSRSPLLQSFVNITTNFARVAHSLYQYGDGFGVQDRDTKKTILSLLVEPMSM